MSVVANFTTDASESLFKVTADMEMFYTGIVYFFLSMFNAPFLFLVIWTLHWKNSQTPNMTFKLMNIINFCLLGQGLGHFITSPCLMFPKLLENFNPVVRVIGATMNTLWICDLPIVTLLAVSRILIFSNLIHPNRFDGRIKTVLFLILTWIFILFLYGVISGNMEMYPPGWGYDFTVPFCHLFDTLEISLSFPCIIISLLSYSGIAYLIFVSFFVTVYISGMIFVWHPALFTMFKFIDMDDKMNQAILNCMWIIHCYVNPCMLLVFNKSLRGDCFRLLKTSKPERAPSRTVMMSIVSMN